MSSSEFDVYVAGLGDEPLTFTDSRFSDATAVTDYLDGLGRPKWIRLGAVTVYSQQIIAIEDRSTS